MYSSLIALENGIKDLLDISIRYGLLEEVIHRDGSGGGATTLVLTSQSMVAVVLALLGLVHLYGWLYLLTVPFLLLAWSARLALGAYQAMNILMDFALGTSVLLFLVIQDHISRLIWVRTSKIRTKWAKAETYLDYRKLCLEVDKEEGTLKWRDDEKDMPQAVLVRRTIEELDEALKENNIAHLKFILGGLFRRNHLGMDGVTLHNHCLSGTKYLLDMYQDKLKECLHHIAASDEMTKSAKEFFFRGARRSFGRTALCLSGGGSMSCYHLGVVKALIEAGLFRYIKVISGASGGSILAAMMAIKTERELLTEVLTEDFSTDFKGDNQMAKEKIDWFFKLRPFPFFRLLITWGVLDKHEFIRTCQFYIGDMTFAEAYERTGRHVNISVSSSSLAGHNGGEELLLNHLTTPNVLIRSAVVASCSLPGILQPSRLLSKNAKGQIGPFYLNGVEWIDGSVQADIPFRGISTMFSVSNCIVSQVNPHVVPFLADDQSEPRKNWFEGIFKMLATDVSYRANSLQQLGLFPRFFGQDISGVFKQTYSGQVTIVPPFRLLDSSGTHAILTPGKEGMRYYIDTGQRACWKHMTHIKHLMAIEIDLVKCVSWISSGMAIPAHRPSPSFTDRSLSLTDSIFYDDEVLEDDVSLSSWSLNNHDADDDLVNREFHFVARSSKPSRKDESRAPPPAAGTHDDGTEDLSPGRRLSTVAAENAEKLLSAVTTRMRWLEEENKRLSHRLSNFLGSVELSPIFDEAKIRAALNDFDMEPSEDLPRASSSSARLEVNTAVSPRSAAEREQEREKRNSGKGTPIFRRHSIHT